MVSIKTERLQLIPLDHEMLSIWKNAGRTALEKFIHLQPNSWNIEKFYEQETFLALRDFWVPMTKKYPFDFLWYTNWEIILTEKSCSVGGIGFGGMPSNEGNTEVGYFVDQKFRGQGIASEALAALKTWAFQDPDLQMLRAETPVDNMASEKVLVKNQFHSTGQKEILTPEPMKVICWECPKI